MSKRLQTIVGDAEIKQGIENLSEQTGLSEGAIRIIKSGRRTPHPRNAYKLALACGCSEEDALALARECIPQRARRTA